MQMGEGEPMQKLLCRHCSPRSAMSSRHAETGSEWRWVAEVQVRGNAQSFLHRPAW